MLAVNNATGPLFKRYSLSALYIEYIQESKIWYLFLSSFPDLPSDF